MNMHSRIALLTGALVGALTMPAQQRPFTYDDMLLLDRISGLSVDATGARALFNVRRTDMENNRGVRSLYLKDLTQPSRAEVRLPVSDSGAVSARWTPDGKGISFLSARRGGTMQLYRCDAQGGNVEQLTRLPLSIEAYRLTPDGRGAVVA